MLCLEEPSAMRASNCDDAKKMGTPFELLDEASVITVANKYGMAFPKNTNGDTYLKVLVFYAATPPPPPPLLLLLLMPCCCCCYERRFAPKYN